MLGLVCISYAVLTSGAWVANRPVKEMLGGVEDYIIKKPLEGYYSMGLVMLGSGSPKAIDQMLQSTHEKIIGGLAVSIAFVCGDTLASGISCTSTGSQGALVTQNAQYITSLTCIPGCYWPFGANDKRSR